MSDPTRLRVLYVRSRPLVQYAKPDGEGELVACAPDEEGAVAVPVPLLDDRLECEALVGILREADLPIRLHRLAQATGDDFTLEMSKGYDVVYFDGHGSETALAFEGPNGERHDLDATALAAAFEDSGTKVAVLSACHSSAQLNAVCQAGVPAAVGMTDAVPQPVAAAYTRGFFTALTQGKTLVQAHGLGLKTIRAKMAAEPSDDKLPMLLPADASITLVASTTAGKLGPTGKPPPSNIALSDRPFIGRNEAMVEVNRALTEHRVVVLEGEPGIGKTALARHVAAWQVERNKCPGGAAFVTFDLPLTRDLAIDTIGTACIGKEFGQTKGNRLELLTQHFAEQPGLVVLDHFENAYRNTAILQLVNDLSPVARVLVTTGEQIGIGKTIMVGELDEDSAIDLFARLAGDAGWDGVGSREALAAICRELGRLPLAIELVAPQAAALSLPAILERVEEDLAAVAADRPGLPERQRSLIASLNVSHDPLPEPARVLFRRMSVLVAGAKGETLADVCEVTDWEMPILKLVNHHLVKFEAGRYTMLPPVRHYALDKLAAAGEKLEFEERFARQFAALANAIHGNMNSAEGAQWMEVAGTERDNLLAGQRWFLEHDKWSEAKDMADLLHEPFTRSGSWAARHEIYAPLRVYAEEKGDRPALAGILHQLGMLAQAQGDIAEARDLYNRSIACDRELGNKSGIAKSLHQLGLLAQEQGDYTEARRLYGQTLAITVELGDKSGTASALHQLGNIARLQGELDQARKLYYRAQDMFKELDAKSEQALSLHQLAMLAQDQGNYAEARKLYEQSLAIESELGNQPAAARTLHQLGIIAQHQGDLARARELCDQALKTFIDLGAKFEQAAVLHQLGRIAQDTGDLAQARRLYDQSLAIRRELGDKAGIAGTLGQKGLLAEAEKDDGAALENYLIALTIFTELKSPSRDVAAQLIANMKQRLGDEAFKKLSDEVVAEMKTPTADR